MRCANSIALALVPRINMKRTFLPRRRALDKKSRMTRRTEMMVSKLNSQNSPTNEGVTMFLLNIAPANNRQMLAMPVALSVSTASERRVDIRLD